MHIVLDLQLGPDLEDFLFFFLFIFYSFLQLLSPDGKVILEYFKLCQDS